MDGHGVSAEIVQNYEKHLAQEIKKAAKTLSLRTIRSTKVEKVQVAEIKGLVSL